MRPRLVRCSAASFVLIAVVMAESFTNSIGCVRSVSESWATTTTAGASNVPKSTQLIANVDFMFVPQFLHGVDSGARRQESPCGAAPKVRSAIGRSYCGSERSDRWAGPGSVGSDCWYAVAQTQPLESG